MTKLERKELKRSVEKKAVLVFQDAFENNTDDDFTLLSAHRCANEAVAFAKAEAKKESVKVNTLRVRWLCVKAVHGWVKDMIGMFNL